MGLKASYFDGDIPGSVKMIRPGVAASLNYHLTPHLALMPEISLVRLMADDHTAAAARKYEMSDIYLRNLHFRNDIVSFSLLGQYDFYPNKDQFRRRPIYNFYGTGGVALIYSNPMAKGPEGAWVELSSFKTENKEYASVAFSVPVGGGIRYKLAISWDIEIEFTYNFSFSDYLDDVSNEYPNPSSLSESYSKYFSNRSGQSQSSLTGEERDFEFIHNELKQKTIAWDDYYRFVEGEGPGTLRGSRKGPDRYFIVTFRMLYILPGGKINCPKFRD